MPKNSFEDRSVTAFGLKTKNGKKQKQFPKLRDG